MDVVRNVPFHFNPHKKELAMQNKNRCVVYCCLTNTSASNGSITIQKKICRRYAAIHRYKVRRIVFDVDMSGDPEPTFVERPKLYELMEFLEKFGGCKIIVPSRSILLGLKSPDISFLDAIADVGGEVCAVNEDTHPNDSNQLILRF